MRNISELQNLNGKIALVTGGAGYLGKAICESLAELGAKVVVASRDLDKCKSFASYLTEKYRVECFGYQVDITSIDSLINLKNDINNLLGPINILINDAWSGKKNSFDSISFEDWNYDINICLNGPFYTTKIFIDDLISTKGVILNVASMYGIVAPDYRLYDSNRYANPPSYGAAKAGLIQLTRYLASFLTVHGIRVNAISPGPFPFESTIEENRNFVDRLENKNILNRIGKPEDLKGVVAFLCSNASLYVTGQNISVDGGWTVW
jgi:NAD(P)-dependent dehydrogenase (short-subunit alcohol dehydrogenase family)